MDALEWFRCRLYPQHYPPGSYPWQQFLRFCVHCTNIQGSALYDSSLGDEALIEAMFEEEKAKQSKKEKPEKKPEEETDVRPPRRGYTRLVEAIYDLTDNVVALRAESGRWPQYQSMRAMPKRPWFPAEVVQERMRKRARQRVNRSINAAQARWQEAHDDARSGT